MLIFFTLLQMNFIISTNILCTNFNVLIIYLCVYIGSIDVQEIPDDDQERLKHVGVMTK
jgi:hypothetical protein